MAQGNIGTTVDINIFSDLGRVFSQIELSQSEALSRSEEALEKVSVTQPQIEEHIPEVAQPTHSIGDLLSESISSREQKELTISNWLRDTLRSSISLPSPPVSNIQELELKDLLPNITRSDFPLIDMMLNRGDYGVESKQYGLWEENIRERLDYNVERYTVEQKAFEVPEFEKAEEREPFVIPEVATAKELVMELFHDIASKGFTHQWNFPAESYKFDYEEYVLTPEKQRTFEVPIFENGVIEYSLPQEDELKAMSFETPVFETKSNDYSLYEISDEKSRAIEIDLPNYESQTSITLPEIETLTQKTFDLSNVIEEVQRAETVLPQITEENAREYQPIEYGTSEVNVVLPELTTENAKSYSLAEFQEQPVLMDLTPLQPSSYTFNLETPEFPVSEMSLSIPDLAPFNPTQISLEPLSLSSNPLQLQEIGFEYPRAEIPNVDLPQTERLDLAMPELAALERMEVAIPELAQEKRGEIEVNTEEMFQGYRPPRSFEFQTDDFRSYSSFDSEIEAIFNVQAAQQASRPHELPSQANNQIQNTIGYGRRTP
jgi:hypothetical protein